MDLHILLIFSICVLVLSQNSVEGKTWKLSKDEELDVEGELKSFNKQPIKTIHTEYGAIYDCIDFYHQPAFDHPKLKDIRYQFKLEPMSNETWDQVSSEAFPNDEGCPYGTVLIRRITKEYLIRHRLDMKYKPYAANDEYYYYAVARTKGEADRYSGAGATLDVCNPKVYERDYSSARVLLRNGPDSIEAGWKVDPYLNSENWPHLYQRTTADGVAHCYHSLCSGFVVTTTTIAPDGRLLKIFQKGGERFTQQLEIARDLKGNWRLRCGPYDKYEIGFWPKEIFSPDELSPFASYVDYGGEVFSQPYTPMPAMGISYFPSTDFWDSSSVSKLTYRNWLGFKVDATDLEPFSNSDFYKVIDLPNAPVGFGHAVLYGGAGGNITT